MSPGVLGGGVVSAGGIAVVSVGMTSGSGVMTGVGATTGLLGVGTETRVVLVVVFTGVGVVVGEVGTAGVGVVGAGWVAVLI